MDTKVHYQTSAMLNQSELQFKSLSQRAKTATANDQKYFKTFESYFAKKI